MTRATRDPTDISPDLLAVMSTADLALYRAALDLDRRAAEDRRDAACVHFCERRIAAIDAALAERAS